MSTLTHRLPVREVTVLEDRAHIVRSGRITLPAGRTLLQLTGVAPVLTDKTAIATLSGPGQALVRNLHIERTQVVSEQSQPADLAALLTMKRSLESKRIALQEEVQLAASELTQVQGVVNHTLTEIGVDAAYARDGTSEWKSALDELAQRERQLRLTQLATAEMLQDLGRETADLITRIMVAQSISYQTRASVNCEIDAPVAGDYELRLAYVVPGACWRPYHTARWLEESPPTIELTCDACIWQNTGEDWTEVTVRCSTERASLGAAPPVLSSDILALKRKEQTLTVEMREQTLQHTGGEAGQPAQEVMGIDDGGETRLLSCLGLATIPSDGMPHRLPLFRTSSPCEASVLVLGEISPAAIQRTSQTNTATVPLLAGPVDLIRRGGLAGRTSILYIAPGSRFDLGWGPDGDIRIHRSVQSAEEKSGLLSSWLTTLTMVDLHLSNLSAQPRSLHLTERIPVSSLEQVVVELDAAQTKPAATADANGMVSWLVTLPARGHATVQLRYRLKKHPAVAGL